MVFSAVGSNRACGSAIATQACGHVLAGELRQVGGLLVGAAPVGQRRRDAAGREDRQRQSHVAVGESLGDEGIGDRAAVRGDPVEVLGDVDRGDAELGGLGDQVRRDRSRRRRRRARRGAGSPRRTPRPSRRSSSARRRGSDRSSRRRWASAGSAVLPRLWIRLNCRVDAPTAENACLDAVAQGRGSADRAACAGRGIPARRAV